MSYLKIFGNVILTLAFIGALLYSFLLLIVHQEMLPVFVWLVGFIVCLNLIVNKYSSNFEKKGYEEIAILAIVLLTTFSFFIHSSHLSDNFLLSEDGKIGNPALGIIHFGETRIKPFESQSYDWIYFPEEQRINTTDSKTDVSLEIYPTNGKVDFLAQMIIADPPVSELQIRKKISEKFKSLKYQDWPKEKDEVIALIDKTLREVEKELNLPQNSLDHKNTSITYLLTRNLSTKKDELPT